MTSSDCRSFSEPNVRIGTPTARPTCTNPSAQLANIDECNGFSVEISSLSARLSKSLIEPENIALVSDLHDEIQSLTASLFEEANNLVAEEAKKTFSLQIQCEKLSNQLDDYKHRNQLLRAELSQLKHELRLQGEDEATSPAVNQNANEEDMYLPKNQSVLSMAIAKTPRLEHQKSPFGMALFSFVEHTKNLNDLFHVGKPKCNLLIKNALFNELQPLLTFCNSKLGPKQILPKILENVVSLERQPSPITEETKACELCLSPMDIEKTFTYRYSSDHFALTICFHCKQQLYLSCELISHLRLVHLQILRMDVDSDRKMLYYRICHTKRAIFYLLTRSTAFFKAIDP